jgi:BMFP domain-containing protein YqiC
MVTLGADAARGREQPDTHRGEERLWVAGAKGAEHFELIDGIAQKKDEIEGRFRAVLTGAFERMNLVGRAEFEASCARLDEARARLKALEERLDRLAQG